MSETGITPFLSNLRDPLEIHSAGEKQILNADAKKTSGFYCSNFSPLRRRRAFSLLEVSIVVKIEKKIAILRMDGRSISKWYYETIDGRCDL